MTTSVTNNSPQTYEDGGDYAINGGTLSLSASSGILGFGGTSSATATVGASAGEFDISLSASIFSGLSGDYVYNLNITNTPSSKFLITFSLDGANQSATANYDGSETAISIVITKGFIFSSSITVNINIPGNPYNLNYGDTNININDDDDGQICYLPGTLIETPQGQIAVELLREGDSIYIFDNNVRTISTLKWTGCRRVIARNDFERPVRILAGALDENVPFKDLLVTPEHCLFFDGCFIPARMLVNGRSIVIDEKYSFDIYHIETENHAVIMADGALAESYLDTGNRHTFQDRRKVVFPNFGQPKIWNIHSAAPLEISRAVVETLFDKIVSRAEFLGIPKVSGIRNVTTDPSLRLIIDGGIEIKPTRKNSKHYIFQVPAGIKQVNLASNASMPSAAIGPFVDDRRVLGVLIGQVQLFHSSHTSIVQSHLETEHLTGWHEREAASMRWTSGMAELPISAVPLTEPAILAIEIITAGPYVISSDHQQTLVA